MKIKNIAEFKTWEGKAIPTTDWLTITQEMVNAFAEATLDFQWIHIDPERATKESPFKTPIAHGFMSVSMLSKLLEMAMTIESVKMGVNYGLNKIRFPHHVPVGSRIRLTGTIAKIDNYGPNGVKTAWDCVVEIEGIDKPACVAQFLTLAFE